MQTSNKQLLAVLGFFALIISAFVIIATSGTDDNSVMVLNSEEKKELNEKENNAPRVEESEPVRVVTSNSNTTSPSTSHSNNNSRTTSNSNSSSRVIPVSYFITDVDANKIYVGGSAKIKVTIKPDNATNKSVSFSSSNSAVAKVTSSGLIIGVNPGKCTIYVKVSGGGTSSFDMQVLKKGSDTEPKSDTVKVTGVNLNSSSIGLTLGTSTSLVATITPSNATNKGLTWTSSNTSVATVINGVVTARSVGTAVITVRTNDGGKTATCRVNVTAPTPSTVKVTGVSLSKTSMNLYVGNTSSLVATVSPSNATNKNITWTSSNNSIATVSNGVVTAKSAGTATITVKTSDGAKTATCKVTVRISPCSPLNVLLLFE